MMNFRNILIRWSDFSFEDYFSRIDSRDIPPLLAKDKLTDWDFLALLSPAALSHLEAMAQKARNLTIQYFGRVIQLYIPLYLSNYCSNDCLYCGFSINNSIKRSRLNMEEIEKNAIKLSGEGMRHILVLTGESPEQTPLAYLEQALSILKKYFSSIAIEIYPLEMEGYKRLKAAGADSLTIYQEVYDQDIYSRVHTKGPKSNYDFRLMCPERGAQAGMRSVNIGALFGLAEPVKEGFLAGLHAHYLQQRFPETEFSLSLPRLNAAEGQYQSGFHLDDTGLVQLILAYRLFLPRTGITLSTRENSTLRDHLLPLGITRMSAGSDTTVGGYSLSNSCETPQFEINDKRSINQIAQTIARLGYEPVFKDWEML